MERTDPHDLQRLSSEGLNEELLTILLEQTSAGVLVVDVETMRVLLANASLSRMLGRPAPAGTEIGSLLIGSRANGQPLAWEEWPLARVLGAGTPAEPEEFEMTRGDGSHLVVRMSVSPLHAEGGAIRALVLHLVDITAQRRIVAARKFATDAGTVLSESFDPVSTLRHIARLAVPTLADWCAIDLVDSEGAIERVAVEHLDRRKTRAATELIRSFPPPLDATDGVADAIRSGKAKLFSEVTPAVLDGMTTTEAHRQILQDLGMRSLMIVPLIARGHSIGAITFVSAESKRVYTVDELEMAEELAGRAALAIENSRLLDASHAASEAKADFLAVMSHELRTPLTAIIGYSELLQLGVPEPVTPRQHEQAERIEVSARHLLQLVEEILTLVTLDSGESRIRKEAIEVAELLLRASTIIEPMARLKGLPLKIEAPEDGLLVHSDPEQLLQILLNLLSNAVKFTDSGQIVLRAYRKEEHVVFEVVDTGIGMGEEHIKRVFEPFWQVERPITRRTGGTGLGLTISRRLADLLGAEIDFETEVGKGSTFRVLVPL